MTEPIRIWRSPQSAFGQVLRQADPWQEETVTALDAYTDSELVRMSGSGFNAIWVHGNLNHVVRTEVFPELGPDAELHQQRLNALVDRAGRHGIQVYLYCQPARAIPRADAFWRQHPDAAGQAETIRDDEHQNLELRSLCTSTEAVRRYLYEAAAELARKVPDLGGLIIITASEYPAHCWTRRGRVIQGDGSVADIASECPRCSQRKPAAVVSEVIQQVRDGVRSVSADWKIITWNWSWTFYVPAPCGEIIAALPKDVVLLVDFERGGHKVIAGKDRIIDEYSLSYAGPSEPFRSTLAIARTHGLPVMAKLQFGTTHELATVPNLPVLGTVFAKADAVREMGLTGFMGCWNFGNMITANTAGFNAFLAGDLPQRRDAALPAFAARYFPGCDPAEVAAAWLKFGEALDHYPFSLPYLYSGPTNFAFILPLQPGPLTGKPVGRCHLLDERGDDMGSAVVDFRIEELIAQFETLTTLWGDGVKRFGSALQSCHDAHAREELDTAAVCRHAFRSTANFCKVYQLRRQWSVGMLPEYQAIVRDELRNLQAVLPILRRDRRFGYHIEAHGYQYDAASVAAKIESLTEQMDCSRAIAKTHTEAGS